MALSEFDEALANIVVGDFVKRRRPPEDIRDKVDLSFRIENQSVIIFEVRPVWDNPKETMESHIAKATYVNTRREWKVYWLRADLKWHPYPPYPVVNSLDRFVDLVDKDENGCFWG